MTVRRVVAGDRGGSTVLLAGGIVTIATLCVVLVGSHSALVVRSRTAGAADASALAAADALAGVVVGSPCDRAAVTAEANGVDLTACVVSGAEATVEVSTALGPIGVTARASAGPPPPSAPPRGRVP
ncbi:Rv3654c family TadE-like protein [Frigoribacterium sp. PhB24]|uniref:Rv3654c family TadE-like protein n=1 Tax=Frigoribacterium sp. PhB24 TaxID=2485204 RepID=UPI000F470ED8|nr:Rv3654c family TadE-like protein [Frigoribacterium sp. PhB24]ROS52907.1 secretion/DNA translocation related TadE-like protein [Frigoribacterium sp. PhB24]